VIPEAVVLSIHIPMGLAMRSQKTGPSFLEPFSSGIAVVGLVSDQSLGSCPWSPWASFGDSDFSKSLIKERDLSRRGPANRGIGMASKRNTVDFGRKIVLDRWRAGEYAQHRACTGIFINVTTVLHF